MRQSVRDFQATGLALGSSHHAQLFIALRSRISHGSSEKGPWGVFGEKRPACTTPTGSAAAVEASSMAVIGWPGCSARISATPSVGVAADAVTVWVKGADSRGRPTRDREGPSNPRRGRRREARRADRDVRARTAPRARSSPGRLTTDGRGASPARGITGQYLSLGGNQDGFGMAAADEGFVGEDPLLVPDVQQVAVMAIVHSASRWMRALLPDGRSPAVRAVAASEKQAPAPLCQPPRAGRGSREAAGNF